MSEDACEVCGERVVAGVQFCTSCGAYLGWREPGAARDAAPRRLLQRRLLQRRVLHRQPRPQRRSRRHRRHRCTLLPSPPLRPPTSARCRPQAPARAAHSAVPPTTPPGGSVSSADTSSARQRQAACCRAQLPHGSLRGGAAGCRTGPGPIAMPARRSGRACRCGSGCGAGWSCSPCSSLPVRSCISSGATRRCNSPGSSPGRPRACHRRAGMDVIDAGQPHPLGNNAERDAMRSSAVYRCHGQRDGGEDHVVLARPIRHRLDGR